MPGKNSENTKKHEVLEEKLRETSKLFFQLLKLITYYPKVYNIIIENYDFVIEKLEWLNKKLNYCIDNKDSKLIKNYIDRKLKEIIDKYIN